VANDETIVKPPSFWDDYAIVLFYLGKKGKAYDCYNNIFPYAKTGLTEHNVSHYLNNLHHSINDNMKNMYDVGMKLENQIGLDNITITHLTPSIRNEKSPYNIFNPSITKTQNGYIMNVRASNYTLDQNFRYIENSQINTINYLINLDANLAVQNTREISNQIMPYPGNFDGWEDMRLFYYKNRLHGSFTTLSATQNRRQHICIANLHDNAPKHILLDGYGNESVQKNWTPIIINDDLFFVYTFYPLVVLKYDEQVKNVVLHQASLP